jgi:hypothetical protein
MNPNDRDLEDLLRDDGGRLGNLYRRLPRYEPPRRLDRAVLGEAARAVRSGKPPRHQRWIIGAGSAAGIVLAAGIAWRIGHEPMTTEAGADHVRIVPVQPITESPRVRQDEELSREAPAPAANAAPQPSGRVGPPADARAPKPARKSAARAETARPATSQASKLATAAPEPAPPPAAAASPQPFPESRDADAQAQSPNAAAGSANATSAAKSATGTTSSERLRRVAPSTPPSRSVELQRDAQLSPDDWLSHVRELVRQGRRRQAIESLRLFVQAHPDRRVPSDLQPLLD